MMISRRKFLKWLGLGSAAVAVAPYLPTVMDKPVVTIPMKRRMADFTRNNDNMVTQFNRPNPEITPGMMVYADPKTGELKPYSAKRITKRSTYPLGMYLGDGLVMIRGQIDIGMMLDKPYYLKGEG